VVYHQHKQLGWQAAAGSGGGDAVVMLNATGAKSAILIQLKPL